MEEINFDKYKNIKRTFGRDIINLNPIQRGGELPLQSKQAIYEYWDGYSVCDYCGGRLDKVETPPIHEYLIDISKFLGMDVTRPTHGARESKFIVMNALCNKGDYVVLDGNAHYTSFVAIERAKLNSAVVPHNGYPTYEVNAEKYSEIIDNLEDEKKPIGLILLTHVEGNYGNLQNAEKVGKIAKKKGYPFLLNCAYTVGRMPVNGKKLNADFLAISGHKSMAAASPCGLLSINNEYGDKILRTSKTHVVKEIEMLGCTSRGVPIVSLMASFPYIAERVKKWNEELKKTQFVVNELESIGFKQLGVKPKQHDLTKFESPILDEIAQKNKRKGYFFYEELKKRGIGGIKRGTTKEVKLSVYGLSWEQVNYVVNSIKEIVKEGIGR